MNYLIKRLTMKLLGYSILFFLISCGSGRTSSGGPMFNDFVIMGSSEFVSDIQDAINRMGGRGRIPYTNKIKQGTVNGRGVALEEGETVFQQYFLWEDIVFILAHEDKHHEQRSEGVKFSCENSVLIEQEANTHACRILKSISGTDVYRVNYLCSLDGKHNEC